MLQSGGSGAWGARHYVAPQVTVTERDASNVSLSAQHPFFLTKVFVMKGVLPVAGALQLLAFTARSASRSSPSVPSLAAVLARRALCGIHTCGLSPDAPSLAARAQRAHCLPPLHRWFAAASLRVGSC